MDTRYTFALTQMPEDAEGRRPQGLEIRDADADVPVALVEYQEAARVLLSHARLVPPRG